MDRVPWNRVILDEFVSLALLTEDEEHIVRARAAGWSRVKMCHTYMMSLATVDRIISRVKTKYAAARAYSTILPDNIDF